MIDKLIQDEFWSQVVKARGGCWLWDGYMASTGHGVYRYQHKSIGAYRMAYMIAYGDIPEGMIICHRCNENLCVNPKHLYVGTQQDNATDRKKTGRRWLYRPEMTLKQYREECLSIQRVQKMLGIGAVELRMLDATGVLTIYRTPVATWAYIKPDIDAFITTYAPLAAFNASSS